VRGLMPQSGVRAHESWLLNKTEAVVLLLLDNINSSSANMGQTCA
jgi:hypothetical protein